MIVFLINKIFQLRTLLLLHTLKTVPISKASL